MYYCNNKTEIQIIIVFCLIYNVILNSSSNHYGEKSPLAVESKTKIQLLISAPVSQTSCALIVQTFHSVIMMFIKDELFLNNFSNVLA